MPVGGDAHSGPAKAALELLDRAQAGPAGLVIEGAMGIGKTTVWSAAVERARDIGYTVLSARAVQAESVLAYAVVADLLAELDTAAFAQLSPYQLLAVDRVLLNERSDGRATDQRVASVAFLSVVTQLAAKAPVLIAIDDVQWLDSSSHAVLAFAVRRLAVPVGVLVTERTAGKGPGRTVSWLQLTSGPPDSVRVAPISLGGLHAAIVKRLGRSFPRATLTRIHEISAGNPFYGLELARAIVGSGSTSSRDTVLTGTLTEVLRLRLRHVDSRVLEALLAASCVADPTVDLVAEATGRPIADVAELLEAAASEGVVTIDGNRVRFEHPLLSHGVYTQASAADRRRMHRVLAGIERHPELKARHLALATISSDPDTLKALDAAAEAATARGAPAAAAELLELAIRRGGDTPMRRFRAAAALLGAGDAIGGRAMLEPALDAMRPGTLRAAALNLLAGLCVYTNGYVAATRHLLEALDHAGENPLLAVQTRLMLSFTQLHEGGFDESLRNADLAAAEAEELGVTPLMSQVLTMRVMVHCICGRGVDTVANERALATEDLAINAPIVFRASANNVQLLAWTGDLDGARAEIAEVRRRCEERGDEADLLFVAVQNVLIEIWRGDLDTADAIARDAAQRAEQVGGDQAVLIAATVQTAVAAYRGDEAVAREQGRRALEIAEHGGAQRMAEWPTMMLGLLDTSLGRYADALAVLDGLITSFPVTPVGTEIITATFIPDAVEVLVGLGRADEAEPLIDALERNGARLDRPWMLAVGARCRAMVQASRGDVAGALTHARRAMDEHARLPMPFERARTQIVLGQLLRRARKKGAAQALSDAVEAFERMGATVWLNRARDELSRTAVQRTDGTALTPGERRVAERAAVGRSNREIATELHVSVKTVESNLSNVYRKLGIRSRAQLAARLSTALT